MRYLRIPSVLLFGLVFCPVLPAENTGRRANQQARPTTYREVYPRPGMPGGNRAAAAIAERDLPARTRTDAPFLVSGPNGQYRDPNGRGGRRGRDYPRSDGYGRTERPGKRPTYGYGSVGAGRGDTIGFVTEKGAYFSDGTFVPAKGYEAERAADLPPQDQMQGGQQPIPQIQQERVEGTPSDETGNIDPLGRPRNYEILGGPQVLIIERPAMNDTQTSGGDVMVRSYSGSEAEYWLNGGDRGTSPTQPIQQEPVSKGDTQGAQNPATAPVE